MGSLRGHGSGFRNFRYGAAKPCACSVTWSGLSVSLLSFTRMISIWSGDTTRRVMESLRGSSWGDEEKARAWAVLLACEPSLCKSVIAFIFSSESESEGGYYSGLNESSRHFVLLSHRYN